MAIWHDLGGPGRVCKCAAGPQYRLQIDAGQLWLT